ncbi:hypothetical protein K8I85_10115 [bacterium]|nr:hypothetical protein [bacterium]
MRIRQRPSFPAGLLIAAGLLLLPSLAAAQGSPLSTYGGRVGFSTTPDQLILGAWGTLTEFSPNLAFRPSGDLGIGDDVLTIIGNADVQYTFAQVARGPVPFFGAGVGVLWFDPDGGGSSTELGLQIYGGVELAYRGYQTGVFEVRLGLDDDMPDLKLTYGFGFY